MSASYLSKYGAVSDRTTNKSLTSKSALKIVDLDELVLANQNDEATFATNNVDKDEDVPRRPSSSSSSSSSFVIVNTTTTNEDSDGDVQVPRRQQLPIKTDVDIDVDVPRKRRRYDSDDENDKADVTITSSGPISQTSTFSSSSSSSSSSSAPRVSETIKSAFLSAGFDADAVAGTTYRDKTGKKIDMVNEFLQQQTIKHAEVIALESQRYELNVGAAQKELKRQAEIELNQAAQAPFARTKDDSELDARLRAQVREGDPMAPIRKSGKQRQDDERDVIINGHDINSSMKRKPLYSGPAPAPNRFGIIPGYRWDGIDRSNGWEAKVFAAKNQQKAKEERRRAFAQSDM